MEKPSKVRMQRGRNVLKYLFRRRHQQPRGAPCASALRRCRGPPARRPCGPAALRSPPRPANASALTSGGQRGARSFPHPAGQSPSPPGAGRGHFPRRLGDTGPSCLHASRRCAEPHGGGVASLGAHRGSRWGWVRGRPGGPAGRKLWLWSGKAVGWPRRPSLGRGDRAPGDHKGLGERGSTVARPRTAPWRLAQRRRDQTKGLWGPGGRTESDRGHQKGCVASPSGNRTPVSRVTGGDTHHYTNEDGGDRPTARPLTGCLPTGPPAQHGPPATAGPDPTAHPTHRPVHSGSPPPRQGPGPPRHWTLPRARRLLPPTRAFRREKGAREGKRGCEDTVGARRPASGQERRGWGGASPPTARLGPGRGRPPSQAPRPAAARRLRRHPPRTAACLPACLPAWRGAAR